MLYRKWQAKQFNSEQVLSLAENLQVSTVLSKVLLSKGADTKEKAEELFLTNHGLSDPFLIKDMDKAVERIRTAIDSGEKIVIYGDYDVDGVCATAVLYSYLENAGANVFYKLPTRETDGYGLNANVLQKLKDKGVDLVVTVDNGISAISEVEFATSINLDIIITDHHLPKADIPKALAVVDPLQPQDTSPCKTLSGVGVAFKLITALEQSDCTEMLEYYSDLVAVGTIADLMVLDGENRTIVKAGLKLLNEGFRQGFNSLIEVCGLMDKEISSESVAYSIAPRINAAGRMGDASVALDLLLCEDEDEAAQLAMFLEEENQRRQDTQNKMAEDITQDILQDQGLVKDRVIVVWSDNFHPGVVGIVASRLVERYAKPAIVLTKDGDEYKGSGRSVASFSLHNALEQTKHLLLRFGGHELAAGLALSKENLEKFRQAINEVANKNEELSKTEPLYIDCMVGLDEINPQSVSQIGCLAPFGNGNQNPLFMVEKTQLLQVFSVSDGKHIRIKVKQGENTLQGIMFNMSPQEFAYSPGDMLDLCVALSIYQSDNGNMVSVRIKEIRPSGLDDKMIDDYDVYKLFKNGFMLSEDKKQLLLPSRQEVAVIYRTIQTQKISCDDLRPLFIKYPQLSSGKIQVIIDVLIDLGLVEACCDHSKNYLKAVAVSNKKDLYASEVMLKLM